ncbi:right-handed parallel beta-helix repeat-containing protein [Methanobrevibacter sp. DSM 116169]|uniref:right-handed parallel beta-helix repeat-containing protein n=1 Tax=Methanobrevibacter sp. DSM 116169 TaxID=3242727 RepID=UPI0038FC603B
MLILFSISSISAEEISTNIEEVSDVGFETTASYDKEIYVNTTGSDGNSGSKDNPYATINQGISSASDSEDVAIYLSEGTFDGTGNVGLTINIDHQSNGGSLTFIGSGNKTIIDAQRISDIFYIPNYNSNITFIDITFINGNGQYGGSVIYNQGSLTIQNCIFLNNSDASNGGAIYHSGNDISILNSIFENNSANTRGGALYIQSATTINLINNIFKNNYFKATSGTMIGTGVCIQNSDNANITNNKFINHSSGLTARDGALYLISVDGYLTNNTFENCQHIGTTYSIVYLSGNNYLKDNKFINSSNTKGNLYNAGNMNVKINYDDAIVTGPTFTLTANVTDDNDNKITGGSVNFYANDILIGSGTVDNGITTWTGNKLLTTGTYELKGDYVNKYGDSEIISGTLTYTAPIITTVEYWVSNVGNDNNPGTENSPFLTINKAIQSASNLNNVIIYLKGETFLGIGNVDLEINLANIDYGSSITFIGLNNIATIDGRETNSIFKSIGSQSVVNLINMTLNNGKSQYGGAITNQGVLTIENCTFSNNYATSHYGGAIYHNSKNSLTINNSTFENNSANYYGGAIAVYQYSPNVILTNNDFINNKVRTAGQGGALYANYVSSISLINNTFIDNSIVTGGTGGSAYIYPSEESYIELNKFINSSSGTYSGLYLSSSVKGTVKNNQFINCTNTGTSKDLIYLAGNNFLEGNTIKNSSSSIGHIYNAGYMNVNITYEDNTVDSTSFTLKATITDDMGNLISGPTSVSNGISFYINDTLLGSARILNGEAILSYVGIPDNGIYNLTGDYLRKYQISTVESATLIISINRENVDIYVATNGSDEEGDGSFLKPFKTIQHAITYGFTQTISPVIHIMEGVYSGNKNTNISVSNAGILTLVGEGYNNTIINGADNSWFFSFGNSLDVIFKNITFKNGFVYNTNLITANNLNMIDCIMNDNYNNRNTIQASNFNANNLTFINNSGPIFLFTNGGIANINNSYFADNSNRVIYSTSRANVNINNSYLINNYFTGYSYDFGGAIFTVGILTSINNHYENNKGPNSGAIAAGTVYSIKDTFINNSAIHATSGFGGAINGAASVDGGASVINGTFINNSATNGGALYNVKEIINCTFINNTAGTFGGAIYLMSSATIKGNDFINNTANTNGNDIYLYGNSMINNITIVFNNTFITNIGDFLIANIYHIDNAIIGAQNIQFYIDDDFIGVSSIQNGIAKLQNSDWIDGEYTFSGKYINDDGSILYQNGTVIVELIMPLNNYTVWVSDNGGNDITGNGSYENPFKTIQKALEHAYTMSRNITVQIMEGNYNGIGNTEISLNNNVMLTFIGLDVNNTIIDGENINKFFIITSKNNIYFYNLTFKNGFTSSVDQLSPIWISENSNVIFNNVNFIDNHGYRGGAITNYGNLIINDSYFYKNGNGEKGGSIWNKGLLTIDNSEFFLSYAGYGGVVWNEGTLNFFNSEIRDSLVYRGSEYAVFEGSGNVTTTNSKIWTSDFDVTGLIFVDGFYLPNQAKRVSINGNNVYMYNITVESFNNEVYFSSDTWGRANINVLEAYDCIFINLDYITINTFISSYFDSCIFDNVSKISFLQPTSGNQNNTIINSIILTNLEFREDFNNINLNYNWWGTNNPTYLIGGVEYTPDTWIILDVIIDKIDDLSKNITISLNKYTDGVNVYGYDGFLFEREFILETNNGTITPNSGNMGEISSIFTSNSYGNNTINVTVDGYTLTFEFILYSSDVKIVVDNFTGDAGETIVIPVYVSANGTIVNNGTIYITIGDKKYNASVFDGLANISIVIPSNPGNYNLTVLFDGESVFNNNVANFTLTVNKFDVGMVVVAPSVDVTENGTVIVTFNETDVDGNIAINVNNNNYEVSIINGVATYVLPKLNVGTYTITVTYAGSNKYNGVKDKTNLIVSKANATFNVTVPGVLSDENGTVEISGPSDATGSVIVTVNDKNYPGTLVNGKVVVDLPVLNPGSYTVTVTYSGDGKYASNVFTSVLTVKDISEPTLSFDNVVMFYQDGTRLVALLTDARGNPIVNQTVVLVINGQSYSRLTNGTGHASIALNLDPGSFNASATYTYGNGSILTLNNTVFINSTVQGSDLTKLYRNGSQYQATILDKDGNPIANTDITMNINGVMYTRKTDSNGVVTLSINLDPGEYIITVKNPKDNLTRSNIITVLPTLISEDLTKYYRNASQYNVKVINEKDELVKNTEVTMNINGVMYKRSTNNEGIVTLSINLDPGEYIITVEHPTSGLHISNIIKVLPTLKGQDITMENNNRKPYEVTLVDGTGKAIANKMIKININGVFYERETNSNGVARLNINLDPNTYIATAEYDGYYTSNIVKVNT